MTADAKFATAVVFGHFIEGVGVNVQIKGMCFLLGFEPFVVVRISVLPYRVYHKSRYTFVKGRISVICRPILLSLGSFKSPICPLHI
jgi:hypothetical protein